MCTVTSIVLPTLYIFDYIYEGAENSKKKTKFMLCSYKGLLRASSVILKVWTIHGWRENFPCGNTLCTYVGPGAVCFVELPWEINFIVCIML